MFAFEGRTQAVSLRPRIGSFDLGAVNNYLATKQDTLVTAMQCHNNLSQHSSIVAVSFAWQRALTFPLENTKILVYAIISNTGIKCLNVFL